MYEDLGDVQLRSGETVESCLLTGPEPQWSARIAHLLGHKGSPWVEQAEAALTDGLDVESRFFILHRNGEAFANIMTTELAGVGILGHVYTQPDERRKGAARALMEKLAPNFRGRNGRALFLGTGYDTPPYHLYARFGFESIEPGSGEMHLYADSEDQFNDQYFAPGEMQIQPFGWPHWPASAPLCAGPWPGVVRCAGQHIVGRVSSENTLLPLVISNVARVAAGDAPKAVALVRPETGAVTGFACFTSHPLWPTTTVVDVYCHPSHWRRADDLLDSLSPPSGRHVAYADSTCPAKAAALEAAGFTPTAALPSRVQQSVQGAARLDVVVYERTT